MPVLGFFKFSVLFRGHSAVTAAAFLSFRGFRE
jgi:hypothetical protein